MKTAATLLLLLSPSTAIQTRQASQQSLQLDQLRSDPDAAAGLVAMEKEYSVSASAAEASLKSIPDVIQLDPIAPAGALSASDVSLISGATGGVADGTMGATGTSSTGATGISSTGTTGGTGSTGGSTGATGGGATKLTDCTNGLAEAEQMFKDNGVTSKDLPEHIERWCGHLFQRRPHIAVSSHVVRQVCTQSRELFDRRPADQRYSDTYERSHEFCLYMKVTLDKVLSQHESYEFVENEHGLPSRKILKTLKEATGVLETGKDRTCCGPHKAPGCYDQFIMDCVCKHDKFCCSVQWDKSCATATEQFLCAKCAV
jgi:hypothetical protein